MMLRSRVNSFTTVRKPRPISAPAFSSCASLQGAQMHPLVMLSHVRVPRHPGCCAGESKTQNTQRSLLDTTVPICQ
jgi:hypothetical protein